MICYEGPHKAFKALLEQAGKVDMLAVQIEEMQERDRERRESGLADNFGVLSRYQADDLRVMMTSGYEDIRVNAEEFVPFSDKKFIHHPYHHHKTILMGVATQLKIISSEAVRLCGTYSSDFVCKPPPPWTMVTVGEYIRCTTIPQLRGISYTIRNYIIILQDGYYSKTHAINIAMGFRRGTAARGAAIKEMVVNKYVPSKSALTDAIRLRQNGLPIEEVEWNTKRGGRLCHGMLFDCREDIGKPWLGAVTMALIPVATRMVHSKVEPIITIYFYAPPKPMEVMGVLRQEVKCDRLYFSPKQYPTPKNLKMTSKSNAFNELKIYIEQSAKRWGSPVVCRAGRSESKIFKCNHSKECKYFFTVKWDKFGFYIPISIGNRNHTGHDRGEACPYFKFLCGYCGEKFHRQKDAIEHEDNFLCSHHYKKSKCK